MNKKNWKDSIIKNQLCWSVCVIVCYHYVELIIIIMSEYAVTLPSKHILGYNLNKLLKTQATRDLGIVIQI